MSVPNFNEVISNINTRLSSAAANANAEELAYLGAAVEKIAGKASALDLLNETEAHKLALANAAQSIVADLEKQRTALSDLAQSLSEELQELKQDYLSQHEEATTNFQNQVEAIVTAELASFQADVNAAVAALQNAVQDTPSLGGQAHIYFLTNS